ncbi:MAG: glycosyltransferase family 39 protein [bacterium]|nr:glycosyltransferase family 39 protein [bacterium]
MQRRQGTYPPGLIALVLVYAALALIYAWATPIFEASDELWHFGMAEFIRENQDLPVQKPDGVPTHWEQEGSQPPLYYTLAAALMLPFDLSDADDHRQLNPHAKVGVPGALDNKNIVLHDTPHPPLRGTVFAVYTVRIFSIALGMVTVCAVYFTARLAVPEGERWKNVPLLAAGLAAFNPMFLFISASLNNDNLVTALNSVVIYLMLQMLRDGFTFPRSLAISLLVALATLTKLSGLVLVPVVALAGVLVAVRQRNLRGLITLGASMLVSWLVLAGWWYARNVLLYHELFGISMMVNVAGPRLEPFRLSTLLAEFEGFRIAFWGLFGTVNVLTFDVFYRIMDAVTVAAVIGLSLHFAALLRKRPLTLPDQQTHPLALLLLALVLVIGMVSVIAWTAQTYASQGRLLFPYLAALCPLFALGLAALFRRLPRPFVRLPQIGLALLALFALMVPFASIAPAYALPRPLTALPESANPVYARYGDVELLGYEAELQRYRPGDEVTITLYWRPQAPSDRDYSLYLHLLDQAGGVMGKVDTYPGGGKLRTTTWTVGVIYRDEYRVRLEQTPSDAFLLRMLVGWWHVPSVTTLEAVDEGGAPIGSVVFTVGGYVGDVALVDAEDFTPVEPVQFGEVVQLRGYRLQGARLWLWWESTGTPDSDYTVFAQALSESRIVVGQGDAPPMLPTRYWRRGENYITFHQFTFNDPVEPGLYPLIIGWYRPSDFARVDTDSPDDAYVLTTMQLP